MEIKREARPIAEVETDALVVIGWEGGPPPGTPAAVAIKELYDSGEFTGKSLEISILHHPAGLKAKRLVLAGAGKKDRFDASELRKLSGAVLRSLKSKGVRGITLALDNSSDADDFTAAAVEGAILATLEPTAIKPIRRKMKNRWTPSRF